MKNAVLLIVGIAAGFVVAHQVNKTTKGQQFFENLDGNLREFGDSVADAYRQREAQLRDAVTDAVDSASDVVSPRTP